MILGIEVLETSAVAVAVDASGNVAARAESRDQSDSAAAVSRALDAIGGSSSMAVAVATPNPETFAASSAGRTLATRFSGQAIASGTAAAVAEAWIGAARGASNLVYFATAEHTLAGVLGNGAPMTGAHHRAPAVGWLALNPVEREDYRKVGCLEAEVGAGGIVRRLVWRIKSGDNSRVADAAAGDFSAITVEQILEAARAGDGVSISVVRDTAKYLGMAAANLVAMLDPDVLVLGGIMASASDLLLEPLRTELGRRLPPSMMQALTIATATLGAEAPAIGAARLASVAQP